MGHTMTDLKTWGEYVMKIGIKKRAVQFRTAILNAE